jgi:rhodanese-related sulfurtransferase
VFIDSRKCNDYAELHVRGAICLPPDNVEERFPSIEAILMPESRLILYCYGPDCDMAERVGAFLAQLGHKNMMIMSSGFSAWHKARFPVDGKNNSDASKGDLLDFWKQYDYADQDLVYMRFCRCINEHMTLNVS